jgi:hypothetical protein
MLPRYCCANPGCHGARHGRPRVLFAARLAPGSVVEPPPCRACGWATRVTVDAAGAVAYGCRPGARNQETGQAIVR